jgi:hypothetical protein
MSHSLIIALSHMINGRSDSHDVLAALSKLTKLMTAALSLLTIVPLCLVCL